MSLFIHRREIFFCHVLVGKSDGQSYLWPDNNGITIRYDRY